MRVVVGERLGGPEVLSIAERETPRPGPGEVVVDVAAAGRNRRHRRRGNRDDVCPACILPATWVRLFRSERSRALLEE